MRPNTSVLLPLNQYDKIIVALSGGKDSAACALHLLDLGVPTEKIELWHQAVDGRGERFMDWPITESYCVAFAQAIGVPLYFQWREGGFLREMLRNNTPTAPVQFMTRSGGIKHVGGKGPDGTRMKFPQVSADLSVRWCSAYLKIDVARRVFSNDCRFDDGTFLFISGERRQESAARSKYAEVERHPSTNRRRRIDQWRCIIDWTEEQVWGIIRRHRIRPHPAYYLGWGRVSCALCIFGDEDQWASARALLPDQFKRISNYEKSFGVTIQRSRSIEQLADAGTSFIPDDERLRTLSMSEEYPQSMILVPQHEEWIMPPGAFKRAGGPT
jgi:3'-phosphoadenosine 5'-phosphosulfate sulfotransferase (PAPS reductase)/FAD synthetase